MTRVYPWSWTTMRSLFFWKSAKGQVRLGSLLVELVWPESLPGHLEDRQEASVCGCVRCLEYNVHCYVQGMFLNPPSSSLSPLPSLFFFSLLQLREEFDRGVDVQLDEEHSVHDVAALLKEFLRDMPDPLLTKELYTAFINTTCELHLPCSSSSFIPCIPLPTLPHTVRPNLCSSAGPGWAAECRSAAGIPAPSMQQWHAPSPSGVPVYCGWSRARPAGQRRTGGERFIKSRHSVAKK